LACWHEAQEASVLFEKTGSENLEITCFTVQRAGCPKRLCHCSAEVLSPTRE
jgi:hypothetical protein